jgi:hypothetical protein
VFLGLSVAYAGLTTTVRFCHQGKTLWNFTLERDSAISGAAATSGVS